MKDQAGLYRFFEASLYNLSNEKITSYNTRDDLFQIYPKVAAEILKSCRKFRTLDDHAREYIRTRQRRIVTQPVRSPVKKLRRYLVSKLVEYGGELPIPDREVQAVKRQLEAFVKDGFVISKEEMHKKVKDTISDCEVVTRNLICLFFGN